MEENSAGKNNRDQAEKHISLRSEDVGEILGRPPGWLVRWGIGILFIIIAIIITGSGLFSYPDIVRAPVIITKENPPSVLIARSAGKAEEIFFPDGAVIEKFDTVAVIENPARYNDVFRLGKYVGLLNRALNSDAGILNVSLPADLVLGNVQPSYNAFTSALNDYRVFITQDFYEKKIAALSAELNEYILYRENLRRQRTLAEREVELGTVQFRRDSVLYVSNVISSAEFEQAQTLLLNKHKDLENARLNLSDAGITIARLERNIADTMLEKEEKQQKLNTSLINSFRQLESSLSLWKNKYLLIAPASGTLNYLSVWSNLQEVKEGESVFSIVPENMGELHARIILPFRRAGKVRPGQRVNIKLEGYPYMEFGMVRGYIKSVSGGPLDNGFPAVIALTNGAVTTFGHELEVVRELPGTAEISTDEMSLLERLFNPLRHLLKNRTITRRS
ncbi:MAG: HlyD family efflux transporter periplasmic adaptor subunit [Bacteroidales bacterium]